MTRGEIGFERLRGDHLRLAEIAYALLDERDRLEGENRALKQQGECPPILSIIEDLESQLTALREENERLKGVLYTKEQTELHGPDLAREE